MAVIGSTSRTVCERIPKFLRARDEKDRGQDYSKWRVGYKFVVTSAREQVGESGMCRVAEF